MCRFLHPHAQGNGTSGALSSRPTHVFDDGETWVCSGYRLRAWRRTCWSGGALLLEAQTILSQPRQIRGWPELPADRGPQPSSEERCRWGDAGSNGARRPATPDTPGRSPNPERDREDARSPCANRREVSCRQSDSAGCNDDEDRGHHPRSPTGPGDTRDGPCRQPRAGSKPGADSRGSRQRVAANQPCRCLVAPLHPY